jgi:RimJ/RimL family protein N-acetyltransferase
MIDLPLRTMHLELRAFTIDDAPAAHAIYGDAEVMAHVGDRLAYGRRPVRFRLWRGWTGVRRGGVPLRT